MVPRPNLDGDSNFTLHLVHPRQSCTSHNWRPTCHGLTPTQTNSGFWVKLAYACRVMKLHTRARACIHILTQKCNMQLQSKHNLNNLACLLFIKVVNLNYTKENLSRKTDIKTIMERDKSKNKDLTQKLLKLDFDCSLQSIYKTKYPEG